MDLFELKYGNLLQGNVVLYLYLLCHVKAVVHCHGMCVSRDHGIR